MSTIKSMPTNENYRNNWDRIFNKKAKDVKGCGNCDCSEKSTKKCSKPKHKNSPLSDA